MPDSNLVLECGICRQQFARADHLRRHEQTHSNDQPFKCNFCERAFSRRDAAKRHQKSHDPAARVQLSSAAQPTLNKSCSACSRSRIRCSGKQPCGQCVSRQLQCTYLLRRKRRRSLSVGSADVDSPQPTSSAPGFVNFTTFVSEPDGSLPESLSISDPLVSASDNGAPAYRQTNDLLVNNVGQVQDGSSSYLGDDGSIYPRQAGIGIHESGNVIHTGTTSPQVAHFRDLASGINWLPFDQSISADMDFPGIDSSTAELTTNPDSATLPSRLQGASDELRYRSAELESSFPLSMHSKMSDLVTSMTLGLGGLSNVLDKGTVAANSSNRERHITLYADGAGARNSRADRAIIERRECHGVNVDPAAPASVPSWTSALQIKIQQSRHDTRAILSIPDSVLEESISHISPRLRNDPILGQHTDQEQIVFRKSTWRFFIAAYFRTFHATHPFLDQSLLCVPIWGWALCVATAAIGARYVYIPEMSDLSDSLCSILHDMLTHQLNMGHAEDSLPYIQARALAVVGLCHSQKYVMMTSGYNAASLLYNSCLQLRLLEEDNRIGSFQEDQDLEHVWVAWRFRESRRRTGLFIWVLDCTLSIATQTPPCFQARALNLRLPSTPELWEAESCQQWADIQTMRSNSTPSLQGLGDEDGSRSMVRAAAQTLSMTRSLPKPNTSLGTSLLTHVLTRKIWDAAWYEEEPEVQFSPGNLQPTANASPATYLATFLAYRQWRNRTCDSLDVLHWDALGISARAGGQEDIVFLQLHLARLVILTPVRELFGHISTCRSLHSAFDSPLLPSELYDTRLLDKHCRQVISIWANKDRYKARLAVIHAGALYWHARRYSTDSFLQPLAVYLAAVTLWAFGRFCKTPQGVAQPLHASGDEASAGTPASSLVNVASGYEVSIQDVSKDTTSTPFEGGTSSVNGSVDESSIDIPSAAAQQTYPTSVSDVTATTTTRRSHYRRRMPSQIQLDRPVDDELVQHFIRFGEGMIMVLEGVSDLHSDEGTEQALREAIIILDSLGGIWAVAENYKGALEAVVE